MTRKKFISDRSTTEQIPSSTPVSVRRLAIGLIVMALIVIGLTSPSGAQMNTSAKTESTRSSSDQVDRNAALFGQCLQDSDAGTHMTKKEWSGAYQRLPIERAKQRQ